MFEFTHNWKVLHSYDVLCTLHVCAHESERLHGCVCSCMHVCEREHEAERFPNMSPECLLYPIQYLFLAPHISVPIDSSDSRQDNNRTSLSHSITTIITDLPRERTGWREGERDEEGRKDGVSEGG